MASSTSVITVGQLTTTFTPPPSCQTPHLGIFSGYVDRREFTRVWGHWGQECVFDIHHSIIDIIVGSPGVYASTCFPEPWAFPFPDKTDVGPEFKQLFVFSPGLHCPSGWTSAWSVERSDNDNIPTGRSDDKVLWSAMGVGQTAIACCPSGFSCGKEQGDCLHALALGDVVSGITIPTYECRTESTITATIMESCSDCFLYAPQVYLIQGLTQETSSWRGRSKDKSGDTGGDGDGSNKGVVSKDESFAGLSRDATIAIGICIPLIVIFASTVGFLLFRRKQKKTQASSRVISIQDNSDLTAKPELEGVQGATTSMRAGVGWMKTEQEGGISVRQPDATAMAPYELRGNDQIPSELATEIQVQHYRRSSYHDSRVNTC